MIKRDWARWILVNGAGMALGFWTLLYVLFALAFGIDFELYWSQAAVEGIEDSERMLRLGLMLGLPLAGAVFTSMQATVLRGSSVDLRWWILAGPMGFAIPALVIWPLTAIWGDIPGPVEPFTIVGGGLVGVALLQWLSLRRSGTKSKRWLILWLLGMPLGMVGFMLIYTVIDAVIFPASEYSIGWAAEVGLIGFALGSGAAALSGRSFFRAISQTKMFAG